MIASFMTHWPKKMPATLAGKPTRFPQKISRSIPDNLWVEWEDYFKWNEFFSNDPPCDYDEPKIHTIREDKHDRWKPGTNIHFYINARKKDMFRFAPVVKVRAVQRVRILHSGEKWRQPWVFIDDRLLTAPEISELAKNDGFEFVSDFFAWFDTDFVGKIIHWTDLKY